MAVASTSRSHLVYGVPYLSAGGIVLRLQSVGGMLQGLEGMPNLWLICSTSTAA